MFKKNKASGPGLRQTLHAQQAVWRAVPGLPWLVAVLFVAALVVSGLAIHKARAVVAVSKTVVTEQAVNYKLKKIPLTANEYKAILEWFQRLHPEVQFDVQKDGLRVLVADGARHTDWIYALGALQSRDPDIVWNADDFCVGRCGSAVAYAVVKGYRQQIAPL